MPLVTVIEDDPAIRTTLRSSLTELGHTVRVAGTAAEGLLHVADTPGDVIVLDLGLPDVDGQDALKMLRGVTNAPVIVATARDDEREIVRALDAGADEYIVKPFSAAQLDARIRAILRRTNTGSAADKVVVGGLVIDHARRAATLDGRPLELSRKEYDLLHYLAARSGAVVTKRELLTEVWHQPYGGADRTVDVHLSWLRRKLGETASEPRYLRVLRGVGAQLIAPDG
jgi:two-component system, OmpR family, KDP operon response regulator KdpE